MASRRLFPFYTSALIFVFVFVVSGPTRVGHAHHCEQIPLASAGDYDPDCDLHIHNPSEAAAVRQDVIDLFWQGGGGLPTNTLPTNSTVYSGTGPFTGELVGRLGAVNSSLVSQVERLDSDVDNLDNIQYLLHPATSGAQPKLAIVHQGHQDWPLGGLDSTTNLLLEQGYSVLAVNMPLVGWNIDRTAILPSGPETWNAGSTGHDQMFPLPNPATDGNAFRFFIEPIVTGINYFENQNPVYDSILMTGLSGGGWATHVASAVDDRIDLSIAVAGSYPIALRPFASGSTGDAEQIWPELYEDTATWIDLYVLSGFGEGREAIQVTNEFDACCFGDNLAVHYEDFVANTISTLGSGQWSHVLDSTHSSHMISPWTIENVIAMAIENGNSVDIDLNGDGQINATDWLFYKAGYGQDLSQMTESQAYEMGDLNGDFLNNHLDFLIFQTEYNQANGEGAFAALSNVPEPSTALLILFGLLLWPVVRNLNLSS